MSNTLIEETISHNLRKVFKQIAESCAVVDRIESEVKLIAVSKQHSIEKINAAFAHGAIHFGENRVEEAKQKIESFSAQKPQPRWHMIGHVQSRKAQDVARHFDVVHSLDSIKLANRLNKFADEANRQIDVLLQVNVSGEASKSGFMAMDWKNDQSQRQTLWEMVQHFQQWPRLNLVGLTTMAPYLADVEATRPVFAKTKTLLLALQNDFPTIALHELSMGMTNDYGVAIEEGATMVRVGRAIFGERSY